MEIQTSGGEIIGILMKLKDDMSDDLTDSQKADEEERPCDTHRSEGERGCHADGDDRDEPPAG